MPGAMLGKCEWIGVPFAGGIPEVPHLQSRSIVVNDLHLHLINAARTVRRHKVDLIEFLNNTMFHPNELAASQEYCRSIEKRLPEFMDVRSDVEGINECHWGAACHYFITQWMGRSGKASHDDEFDSKVSVRWTSSGGDSNKRFRSAVEAISEFSRSFQRCNFTAIDFGEFLSKCIDNPAHGIYADDGTNGLYCDPPWPDAGDVYRHKFTEKEQIDLVRMLNEFVNIRIVVRFGEHPLIKDLYLESDGWKWRSMTGRTQGNSDQREFFISKRCQG